MKKNRNRNRNRSRGLGNDFSLTAPLDARTFRQERRAAERLQFRPLQRQIQKERKASQFRQKEIGNWFGDYQAKLAQLRGEAQQANIQAQSYLGGLNAQNNAAAMQQQQAMQQSQAQDAALRGVAYQPSSIGPQAAQARGNMAASIGGLMATQGANQFGYLADRERSAARESIDARQEEQRRRLGINEDLRELAKQRGDFRTDYLRESRGEERDYKIQRMAFAEDKKARKQDARDARADNALDRQEFLERQRHNLATEANSRATQRRLRRQDRYERRHPNAGSGDNPRRNAQEQRRESRRLIREMQGDVEGAIPPKANGEQLDTALKKYAYLQNNRRAAINHLLQGDGNPTQSQAEKAYRKALAALKRQIRKDQLEAA